MANTELNFVIKIDPAREEALALADKYVTDWTEQTKNQRGYVHDKWTPVEVTTRTEAVLRVAEWLLKRPTWQEPKLVAPEAHLHRASCDDAGGNHVCGYPGGPTIASPPADPRDVPPGY